MKKDKTYYEVLNLSEDASAEELKQAYRSLIKKWHPDLNPDKRDAAKVTRKIIEAYEVLSDPLKRSQYDEYLSMTRPVPNTDSASETDYSNMSFEEYAENTAYGTYSAWQDSFNEKPHKFDEEGYKEYVKNKKSIFDKEVKLPKVGIIFLVLLPLSSLFFFGKGHNSKLIVQLIPVIIAIPLIILEIHNRNKAARKKREKRLGGNESIAAADKWFDVWLYPEMPISECRKTFFDFSVRVDKHILSRFNELSEEEKKEYADIIELLQECINYREKN